MQDRFSTMWIVVTFNMTFDDIPCIVLSTFLKEDAKGLHSCKSPGIDVVKRDSNINPYRHDFSVPGFET